jgi:uncharacterized protein (DUF2336 family)
MTEPKREIEVLSPPEALRLLEERARAAQHELACRSDAGQDVLHYLAVKGHSATRQAVAANPSAAPATNRHLADDVEDDVRIELARKMGRLLPGLLAEEARHLRAITIQTLEQLARDEEPRVRAILAEEIKTLDMVPKEVIDRLARDVETIVAGPVLEYSPLLSDIDLIEIIAGAEASEVLAAVARRKPLSAAVADVLVVTLDIPAIAALLANQDAQVRKKTLDRIVDQAAEVQEWHAPLVMRPELSQRAIRRIATFVGASLIEALGAGHNLDAETRTHLNRALRARLEKPENDAPAAQDRARSDVAAAVRAGKLDEFYVEGAAEEGRRDHVIFALAHLTRLPAEMVQHVFATGTAKPVTALVWRAGLGMRTAFKIQTSILKLKSGDLLHARGGVRFPMSEDEMRWQLDYFGIKD